MKLGLHFPELLSGALTVVKEELEQLVAAIRSSWDVQHTHNGKHHDITTDSLTAEKIFVGPAPNANSKMPRFGITVNQGQTSLVESAYTAQSASMSHGMSGIMDGTSWFDVVMRNRSSGGAALRGISTETEGIGCTLHGFLATAGSTRSTAALGALALNGALQSGTGVGSLGANTNIAVIRDNGTTRFIFDSDGDSHQDAGAGGGADWTNYDDQQDLQILDSLALSLEKQRPDHLRLTFIHSLEEARAVLEALPGKPLVTFNEDGHHFVNMSRLTMLLVGAVRQQQRQIQQLEQRLLR